jgi:hypothetical protein
MTIGNAMVNITSAATLPTASVASATPSLARLDNDITPRPMLHRQRHRYQDLLPISCHSQHRFGNAIANETR